MKPQRRTAGLPTFVCLKIKGQDGFTVFFKVKRDTRLKKLMTAYCDKRSLEFRYTTFLVDGRRIRGGETPDQLGMEDGDVIDAMLPQDGGTMSLNDRKFFLSVDLGRNIEKLEKNSVIGLDRW